MKTVTTSIYGGLGNQLFQYAAALSLSQHINAKLVLDLSWFEVVKYRANTTTRTFALQPFALNVETVTSKHPILRHFLVKIQRLLGITLTKIPYYHEQSFQFDADIYAINDSVHLDGYWQSYQYFKGVAQQLSKNIGTPNNLNTQNQAMLDTIAANDAICVHIRRGDYVTNQHAAETHGLCDLAYYQRGVEYVMKNLSRPHAFVFSDDPQWARENLKLKIPTTIVDFNGPDEAHLDLWLMAACQRFVIANSSLSWWAAWLGKSDDKIVVAPKKWFTKDDRTTQDLIPPEWLRF